MESNFVKATPRLASARPESAKWLVAARPVADGPLMTQVKLRLVADHTTRVRISNDGVQGPQHVWREPVIT